MSSKAERMNGAGRGMCRTRRLAERDRSARAVRSVGSKVQPLLGLELVAVMCTVRQDLKRDLDTPFGIYVQDSPDQL